MFPTNTLMHLLRRIVFVSLFFYLSAIFLRIAVMSSNFSAWFLMTSCCCCIKARMDSWRRLAFSFALEATSTFFTFSWWRRRSLSSRIFCSAACSSIFFSFNADCCAKLDAKVPKSGEILLGEWDKEESDGVLTLLVSGV